MLARLLIISKIALCLALTGMCTAGGLMLWHLSSAIDATQQQIGQIAEVEAGKVNSVLDRTSLAVDSLQAIAANVNRPCGKGFPCGTLADINKTLATLRMTAGQVEVAANHEDKRLGVLDAQEAQLYSDTHAMLGSANDTITKLQPVETSLASEIEELHKTTSDIDNVLASPAMLASIQNIDATTKNLAATTTDFQTKFHAVLFPRQCTGHWCWLIKAWPYVKAAGDMAQPLYWGQQIWESR